MTHQKQDNIRKTMIGAPLLLTLVFCFGLFLIHPTNIGVTRSTAIKSQTRKKKPTSSTEVKQLAPMTPSHTSLQPLDQAKPSGSSGVTATTSPQSSVSKAVNPQSSANQRSGNTYSNVTNPTSTGGGASKDQLNIGGLIPTTLNNLLKL